MKFALTNIGKKQIIDFSVLFQLNNFSHLSSPHRQSNHLSQQSAIILDAIIQNQYCRRSSSRELTSLTWGAGDPTLAQHFSCVYLQSRPLHENGDNWFISAKRRRGRARDRPVIGTRRAQLRPSHFHASTKKPKILQHFGGEIQYTKVLKK